MSEPETLVVVLDSGSGIIKIGYAGVEDPSHTFPAIVGQKRNLVVDQPTVHSGGFYIGHEADNHKSVLALSYPRSSGFVTDWDDMIDLWTHAFNSMYIFKEDALPTLLTEPPMCTRNQRLRTAEIMFETFRVPSLCFESTAVLNLLSAGLNTGVSVDLGDGISSAVTVYKGKEVANSIQRIDFGGRDLAKFLMRMLECNVSNVWPGYEGIHRTSNSASTRRYVTKAMEKHCYVAQNFKTELLKEPQEYSFKLADESEIKMGNEAFGCPEALFQLAFVGLSAGGIHEMTCRAIESSDKDIQETLYENIVLCGGVAQLPGLLQRLQQEVSALAPGQVNVNISCPPKFMKSAWKGGSCLAATSRFKDMLTSKMKYHEAGENAFL